MEVTENQPRAPPGLDAPHIVVAPNSLVDQWVEEGNCIFGSSVIISAYVGMGNSQSRAMFFE